MWELIQANKRKSILIFICMGICLMALGYLSGVILLRRYPGSGSLGIYAALAIWVFLSFISYVSGDSIILGISRAAEVTHDIHPQLFNVVEEMKIAANLPYMPRIYIIPSRAANAFATGIKPERSAIAVTAGLLSSLDRDELQGVIAHEMSHIVNRDVLYVTFAGTLLGGVILLSTILRRGLWFSSDTERRYRSKDSSSRLELMIIGVVISVLATVIAKLLYFALSRRREYLADASAVRLTRYPEGLASALDKISGSSYQCNFANEVTGAMCIVNPFAGDDEGWEDSGLTSSHPPTAERVKILRAMQQGVSYSHYQEAFSAVRGSKASTVIPASGLLEIDNAPIRKPSAEKQAELKQRENQKKEHNRDVGDILRAIDNYMFLVCACGLRIKIPPNFKAAKVVCPKCKRPLELPSVQLANIAAAASIAVADEKKIEPSPDTNKVFIYTRKSKGWESFLCPCGTPQQLSPVFMGTHITCHVCGRKIGIKSLPENPAAPGINPGQASGETTAHGY